MMEPDQESTRHLQTVRQSSIFRWALALQWFGLAVFVLAVGLALFTDLHRTVGGITTIAVLGMLALLSLVPARFILTVQLMNPKPKTEQPTPPGDQQPR
jgi:hypothetical protein